MRPIKLLLLFFLFSTLAACIGDDYIDDLVSESVRITSLVDTLGVGDTFQLEALYTNNVGQEEAANLVWMSSDETVLSIDNAGQATGIAAGSAVVEVIVEVNGTTITDERRIEVADETVVGNGDVRSGELKTTSSYVLRGAFDFKLEGDSLILSLGEDYKASSSLPGLYVYLTNNPTTTNGAYEIGPAISFDGAHRYAIPASDVMLQEYDYVLYFCKPFNVKVGDGAFEN